MQEDVCAPAVCTNSDLIVGFANSGTELTAWLTRYAGEPTVDRVDEVDVVAARDLRAALLTLLRAHSGCAADDEVAGAQGYLERIAARYPLVPRISAEGCTLAPAQTGVLGVFGAVLAAVTNLAYQGGWPRVKVCKNIGCHAAFFDKTRNSSGLYCSPACSSQVSMRAYRSRQRSA
jgi:predicted RNA-binding Zn ribbon-like protein